MTNFEMFLGNCFFKTSFHLAVSRHARDIYILLIFLYFVSLLKNRSSTFTFFLDFFQIVAKKTFVCLFI